MKTRHLILGLLILLFAAGVWRIMQSPPEPVISTTPAEAPVIANVQIARSNSGPRRVGEEPVAVTDALPMEEAGKRFAQAISAAGTCLGISMVASSDRVAPTTAEWIAEARRDIGDPILDTEDWSVTTIQTPSGERRFIRFEIDYSDPENVARKLSYFRDLGDGTAIQIPLSEEQATEPSETFKATLESDGQILEREKSHRLYFETGEEIIVTEKDGMIFEIDMNRQGKNFSCRPFDPSPFSCQCR